MKLNHPLKVLALTTLTALGLAITVGSALAGPGNPPIIPSGSKVVGEKVNPVRNEPHGTYRVLVDTLRRYAPISATNFTEYTNCENRSC
jgi:hypothetical protein